MCERARVVAGPRRNLRAEEVRLLLVVAAVAEQQRAETELGACRDVPASSPPTTAPHIGPPGSANALMSFRFTGVNEYS